jgi:hypothetical protein
MWYRLVLIALICALVVPRMAWETHLAGHEAMSTAAVVHSHHSDHMHEQDADQPAPDRTAAHEDEADGGIRHDHTPMHAVSTAMLPDDVPVLATWFAPTEMLFDLTSTARACAHTECLVRPPRAA